MEYLRKSKRKSFLEKTLKKDRSQLLYLKEKPHWTIKGSKTIFIRFIDGYLGFCGSREVVHVDMVIGFSIEEIVPHDPVTIPIEEGNGSI